MKKRRAHASQVWKTNKRQVFLSVVIMLGLAWGKTGWTEELAGAALVQGRCGMCHDAKGDGKLDPIESERKTPEGWEMTISRMIQMHGLRLRPNEGSALVKYLSDQYGLAPSEIGLYRYALEKRNSTVVQSDLPKVVQGACLTCHSYARIALQRRTPEAWKRVVDMKLALFTNTENVTASSGLLNSFWYDDAVKDVVPHISKQFPFVTDAWMQWQAVKKPNYEGTWKVVGHDAGKGGDYTGQLVLKALGNDRYEGTFAHEFSDGVKITGKTTAVIYTGFQWRGIAQSADNPRQQEIFFGSEDGAMLTGRRLLTGLGDLGRDEEWYRVKDEARLLTIIPPSLKVGTAQKVKLFGMKFPSGLTADKVNLGEGIKIQSLSQSGDDTLIIEAVTDQNAKAGARQVKIGDVEGEAIIQVYPRIDYIRLFPEEGFARPGGIKARKLMEQYEAIGYLNGEDGVKGTEDDIRIGRVAPVQWRLEENVTRVNDDDAHFVGKVDEHGLFIPAEDGPNPKRERSEHNVGDVWVEAWYTPDGAKRPIGARASMLVMPEKFNFQPIE